MSAGFQAVQWNRRKIVYDAILLGGVALFIGMFMTLGALAQSAQPIRPRGSACASRRSAPARS